MRWGRTIGFAVVLGAALAGVSLSCGSSKHPATTGDVLPDAGLVDVGFGTSNFGGGDGVTPGPACNSVAMGKSSVGCEYYVLPPAPLDLFTGTSSCLAMFLANNSTTPVTIGVEYQGKQLDPSTFSYLPSGGGTTITYDPIKNATIPAQQVAIVMLTNEMGTPCPGNMQSATGRAAQKGTGIGDAFHVVTTSPVSAYDLYPYGGGNSAVTSATLLLPTPAWDVNYVATTAYDNANGIVAGSASPWLGFVASKPTDITVLPPVAIAAGMSVVSSPANQPVTYHLDKGQYLQLVQPQDLSGTIVKSTQPIGVWGGNVCADIPNDAGYCDGMHQQLPPVRALGSRYVGIRYRNRIDGAEETVPWRIVGAVDGTTLLFDPPIPGAPTSVKTGQVAQFLAPGPFVVSSQDADHPFYFAGYMTGCGSLGATPIGCPGDPEFVNVLPDNQYLTSYTFFTDPTYPDTNLVFVRGRDSKGVYQDVSLDCVGTLSGWTDVNPSFQYTRVDLVKGNFAKQGSCDNGRHEAHGIAPFGLTVWGWGSNESAPFMSEYVSYAYPAGASIAQVNTVVVPTVVK